VDDAREVADVDDARGDCGRRLADGVPGVVAPAHRAVRERERDEFPFLRADVDDAARYRRRRLD
jgi:hypothetical protein